MIKNVFIKNLLINTVFRGFSIINSFTKKEDRNILLYANEGFRDNLKYLFEYMIEQGYNRHYHIIIAASDADRHKALEKNRNVKVVDIKQGIAAYLHSAHVFYAFGRLPIAVAGQSVIQMWHGTPFKGDDASSRRTRKMNDRFYTSVLSPSEYFRPIMARVMGVDSKRIDICGMPRCDSLYKGADYDLGDYKKIIIWMPTFRKSSSLGYTDVDTDNTIPLYKDAELAQLNELLSELDMRMIVKLHPMQDPPKMAENFSNLTLMTNDMFNLAGYDLYRLLAQTDALITDYSSVFYDYLLLDRPIAFTEDDWEEYGGSRGFNVPDPKGFRPGHKLKTKEDMKDFLKCLASGVDTYKEKRDEINVLSNYFRDGKNCERILKLSEIKREDRG